jgi:hypothetical protein
MLPRALLAALCAFCALPAAADAAAPARSALVSCERGVEEDERAAVFEGRMSAVPGATRMQMRFALQMRRSDDERWAAVPASGFDTWVTANPGTRRYVYTKRVERLLAPAAYRTVVRFRWMAADGRVVVRARAASRACRQPDPRPNLVIRDITVQEAANPARRSYLVLVRNTGRSAAAPSAVALAVGGTALAPAEAPALAPGRTALVAFDGPACRSGHPLEATVDTRDAVDERAEDDNVLSLPCP